MFSFNIFYFLFQVNKNKFIYNQNEMAKNENNCLHVC